MTIISPVTVSIADAWSVSDKLNFLFRSLVTYLQHILSENTNLCCAITPAYNNNLSTWVRVHELQGECLYQNLEWGHQCKLSPQEFWYFWCILPTLVDSLFFISVNCCALVLDEMALFTLKTEICCIKNWVRNAAAAAVGDIIFTGTCMSIIHPTDSCTEQFIQNS